MEKSISVIGAGIGGLTTALTFQQRGLDVKVFEASSVIKPVGAGIVLANNAMQVFQQLGLQTQIAAAGNRISCMKITDTQLRALSVVDLSRYERQYGVHNIAIHRGVLQQILVNAVGMQHIVLSKRLTKIEKSTPYQLTFEDHSTVQSHIVIGADGIKSLVRHQVFGESKLRNAHQICWRGICEMNLPVRYQTELNEAWGKGKRFGFVQISDKKVYWYALANEKSIDDAETTDLMTLFADFHDDILAIIAATSREQIKVSDISDLPKLSQWQAEHICLIGDAAHATTPNLGQGACQAIEDAYVLGKLLDKGIPMAATFAQYEALRRKKASEIVQTSWAIGQLAHIENRLGVWLRNQALKSIPTSANIKQMDKIFQLSKV